MRMYAAFLIQVLMIVYSIPQLLRVLGLISQVEHRKDISVRTFTRFKHICTLSSYRFITITSEYQLRPDSLTPAKCLYLVRMDFLITMK